MFRIVFGKTSVQAEIGDAVCIYINVSAIFDCYDLDVLGLSMSDNMKTELCTSTIENMVKSNPSVCGMILHSDRGSQYTSASYRAELSRHGIIQSMNSDGAMIMHAVRLCGQE